MKILIIFALCLFLVSCSKTGERRLQKIADGDYIEGQDFSEEYSESEEEVSPLIF